MNQFQCPRNSERNSCDGCRRSAQEASSETARQLGREAVEASWIGEIIAPQVAIFMDETQPLDAIDEGIMTCEERRERSVQRAADLTRQFIEQGSS